jgi:hypothetical protein
MGWRPLFGALGLLVVCSSLSAAQPAVPVEGGGVTWSPTPATTVRLFPQGEIYGLNVADPHRTTNVVAAGFYTRKRIPESRSPRTTLAGGGHFGMLRIESSRPGGRAWQVSIDAGLDALFDSNYKNDAVGWDGNYGLTATTAANGSPLAFKVAVLHVSAHLGDEYEERTNSRRINYTREELALGIAWRRPRWRAYAETGMAYIMRSPAQERGRWQGGLEYESAPRVFGGRMSWFGASDFSGMQERDWRLDTSLQGGIVARSGGRAYRLYAQWYDGRAPLGQFYKYSEASFSLAFKVDL